MVMNILTGMKYLLGVDLRTKMVKKRIYDGTKKGLDIRHTSRIKKLALKDYYDEIWVETASGEGLILPKKYGKKWWKKAKNKDIRRIIIR